MRLYEIAGKDGYPPEWHETIKHQVRADAGHRCERCKHPYVVGQKYEQPWSPCDEECRHGGPMREVDGVVQAQSRVLTVHHLNGIKLDCRWWNLAALCQRCHLTIQGRVKMEQVYPYEHSEWFKPHAAGYYAAAYLGEELTREEAMARLDELLALELVA